MAMFVVESSQRHLARKKYGIHCDQLNFEVATLHLVEPLKANVEMHHTSVTLLNL